MKMQPNLTKNQLLVFAQLQQSNCPLSAYTLLDELRDEGLKAPLQIYRALDALIANGMVHRLESLNAFVACSHPTCNEHESIAFAICDDCGHVNEISDNQLATKLTDLALKTGFSTTKVSIELRGRCQDCKQA